MTDDLPYELRTCRRELQAEAKMYQDKGHRAWVAYPARLIVDGHEIRKLSPKFMPRQATGPPRQHQHRRAGSNNTLPETHAPSATGGAPPAPRHQSMDTSQRFQHRPVARPASAPIPAKRSDASLRVPTSSGGGQDASLASGGASSLSGARP